MELRAFWETTSFSASQDIPRILWNSEFHYLILKSPPLVPIPSQFNPVKFTDAPAQASGILVLTVYFNFINFTFRYSLLFLISTLDSCHSFSDHLHYFVLDPVTSALQPASSHINTSISFTKLKINESCGHTEEIGRLLNIHFLHEPPVQNLQHLLNTNWRISTHENNFL
jgi:hypothetical protein